MFLNAVSILILQIIHINVWICSFYEVSCEYVQQVGYVQSYDLVLGCRLHCLRFYHSWVRSNSRMRQSYCLRSLGTSSEGRSGSY